LRIRLEKVSKKYGATRALDDLSLQFDAGRIVASLGANGAGKTSLLRCLSALVTPDQGQIFFDDEPLRRDRMDLRRKFLFLPDYPVVYGNMTPLRHIAMVLRLYEKDGLDLEERAIETLEHLDLLPLIDKPLWNLSRGQLYKVALAAMFILDPEAWLLDEPFASGIDPNGIVYLKKQFRDAATRGRTILYSTQLLDTAESFSGQVCVLERGRVRLFATVDEIRRMANKDQGALEQVFQQLREERA
jgi:ABC-type multidrug transport system ATPase subunit